MHVKLLLIIFGAGIAVRFLFFPGNVYFGFDQARDAFAAKEIAQGNLKLVGPTTSYPGLSHGVVYYYLITPIYLLGQGDPLALSVFLRVLNGLGIFLIFYLGLTIFSAKKEIKVPTALVAAILFAFSFEQNQFSVYMGNPALSQLSVMAVFLGLALVIFKQKGWGLILSAVALGLSIQFEFALIYLAVPLILIFLFYLRSFLKVKITNFFLASILFVASISSFILVELKYNYPTINALFNLRGYNPDKSIFVSLGSYFDSLQTLVKLNLTGEIFPPLVVLLILAGGLAYLLFVDKSFNKELKFLSVYFFSLIFAYLIGGGRSSGEQLYYTNAGIAPALTIFVSFLAVLLFRKIHLTTSFLIIGIVIANLLMIFKYSPHGTITAINVQQGMLLSDEKKVIDLVYQDAKGEKFAAKGLTMPLYINTTWSYLYEWYGQKKYGYLPVWGDKNAIGYPGNLIVEDRQHSLPTLRYLVAEPPFGIREIDINDYFRVEGYFTSIEWEKRVGAFRVQKRNPLDSYDKLLIHDA